MTAALICQTNVFLAHRILFQFKEMRFVLFIQNNEYPMDIWVEYAFKWHQISLDDRIFACRFAGLDQIRHFAINYNLRLLMRIWKIETNGKSCKTRISNQRHPKNHEMTANF